MDGVAHASGARYGMQCDMNHTKFQRTGQLTFHETFGTETHAKVFDAIQSLLRVQEEETRPEMLLQVSYDHVRSMIMLTESFHWAKDVSKLQISLYMDPRYLVSTNMIWGVRCGSLVALQWARISSKIRSYIIEALRLR